MNQTRTTNSKLKPLNLEKDNKTFDAFNEKKEVDFVKCDHKRVKFQNGKLVCPCGAVWMGYRLQELFDLLTKK